jgi:hypothetical protein
MTVAGMITRSAESSDSLEFSPVPERSTILAPRSSNTDAGSSFASCSTTLPSRFERLVVTWALGCHLRTAAMSFATNSGTLPASIQRATTTRSFTGST